MLTQETIDIVKATVPVIREHGAKVTSVFYHNILSDNPALNSLFNQGNQASGHQSQALASAVLAYAQYIDAPQNLGAAVKHITQKHASLFIKPEQYDVVGQYLLNAFAEVLQDAFTAEIRAAWAAAYGELATVMINAEAELYKQAEEWTDWRDFIIKQKKIESSEITSFHLYPKDGRPLPQFLPGQYISIRVHIPNVNYTQIRQYSLSDSYSSDHYRISVKKEPGVSLNDIQHPGLVSNVLHRQTSEGDTVQLSRPYGTFGLDTSTNSSSPLVLISAGVGVTPMISILNTVLANTPGRSVSWIHGANSSDKRAFSDHIDHIAEHNDNVHVTRFITKLTDDDKEGVQYDKVGRVNLDDCNEDLLLDDETTQYYICGPSTFMSTMQRQLETRGVESARIRSEKFGTGGF